MGVMNILCLLTIATVQAANKYRNDYAHLSNQGFPQFPNMPQIVVPTMAPIVFPNFPQIQPLSPQDIINRQIPPGMNFNGVAISSSSSSHTDRFGNVIQNGGTKIVTNNNGVVKEFKYGDNPDNNIVFSSIAQPQVPKMTFPPIPPIKPIDPVVISQFKPGQNQQFTGRSIVSYHHESNINGDKSGGGVATVIENNNGKVNKKTFKYGDLKDEYDNENTY